MVRTMDARNEWNRARKVMQKFGTARVSFSAGTVTESSIGRVRMMVGNTKRKTIRDEVNDRVNRLEAISRHGMKQVLKAVVEVQYTTDGLSIAR